MNNSTPSLKLLNKVQYPSGYKGAVLKTESRLTTERGFKSYLHRHLILDCFNSLIYSSEVLRAVCSGEFCIVLPTRIYQASIRLCFYNVLLLSSTSKKTILLRVYLSSKVISESGFSSYSSILPRLVLPIAIYH